jgi:hypothetical protein
VRIATRPFADRNGIPLATHRGFSPALPGQKKTTDRPTQLWAAVFTFLLISVVSSATAQYRGNANRLSVHFPSAWVLK